jgi:hypothetical protein
LEITDTFSEPYLGGSTNSSLPSSFSPSVIGINGVPYLMDNASGEFRRESFEVVQQRNTTDNRDVLLLPQDVWRWQEQSWHLGAGQSNLDRDDALQYRYNDSFGIDPWNRWQINLLPATERLYNTESLSGKTWLTTYGEYLAVINGETVYWYDSLSTGSVSLHGSTVINSGNTVVDIANMGQTVTALLSNYRVYTVNGPGSSPTVRAGTFTNANFIAWEKDYLLIGQENKLYDITGSSSNLIYTHPVSTFRWESAAPGNSCIYVLGGAQDHWVVHRVGIKSDGTGLAPAIVAATLPDGEIGYCIDSYLGYVLIGTNKGIRVATENNANGDLTLGPIIPTAEPVRCFEGQDRFVWYGLSSMNGYYNGTDNYFPQSPVAGLGRLDLSVSTTTALTPAYANDICAITVPAATVRSCVTFGDKRVFSIDSNGVWFETSNLMNSGWLTEGTLSFSVEDMKTGLYVQAKWLPLVGSIQLDISYDSDSYARLVNFSIPDSIRSGNISLSGTQFSRAQARHRLNRDTSVHTVGPTMTRWELRAIPVKGRTSRWTLPIMNYEELEIDGVKYTRDPLAVCNELISLVENSTIFSLQESGQSYQVHARKFVWQPEKLSINGRSWEGMFTLVVEEVQ